MRITVSFKVRNWEQEAETASKIARKAGRGYVGSGFAFTTNERDYEYVFRDEKKGRAFVRNVKRIKGVRTDIWN